MPAVSPPPPGPDRPLRPAPLEFSQRENWGVHRPSLAVQIRCRLTNQPPPAPGQPHLAAIGAPKSDPKVFVLFQERMSCFEASLATSIRRVRPDQRS